MRARLTPYTVLACGAIALGLVLRATDLGRSLWLDEAWVANSVLEPRLLDCLYYPAWLQTTPPLLLVLLRAAVGALGPSNVAFRLVPFLFGAAALILFADLARRVLPRWPALVALLLFAVSPPLAWFASSAKQFSSDAFAGVALLALCERVMERPSVRRLGAAVALYVPLALLSYSAQLFLPVLAWAGLRVDGRSGAAGRPAGAADAVRRFAPLLAVLGVGVALAALSQLAFVQPNRDATLVSYWGGAFPTDWHASPLYHYLRDRLTGPFTAPFFFTPGHHVLRLLTVALLLVGGASVLLRGLAGRRRDLDLAALLLGAPATLVVANALALYPLPPDLYGARVLLFAFPALSLLFGQGLAALDALATRLLGGRALPQGSRPRAPASVTVGVALALVLALRMNVQGVAGYARTGFLEDAQSAVAGVAAAATPDDVVYVHASMVEQFKLYSRFTPVPARRIVLGEIGGPCCPRDAHPDWGVPAENVVPGEVERLGLDRLHGRLLLLFADRGGYWRLVGRRDPFAFLEELGSRGCTRIDVQRVPGARFDTYRCGSPHTG